MLLIHLLVFGTLMQVIAISDTFAAGAMGAETTSDATEARSLRVCLRVNIRSHGELLLLVLVRDHGCLQPWRVASSGSQIFRHLGVHLSPASFLMRGGVLAVGLHHRLCAHPVQRYQ